eukprot:TRINITY_DN51302_c0_g1_i1.p1 TRINITY_DN51302_c0_g1~~TRINITY_DN51302_c0_g1_i1.p1  ORF type:complete len:116 (+),score=28.15 TRINITY_DN51302_c0_g1_i1:125-472(+)
MCIRDRARLCIETKNVSIHENSPVVTYSRQFPAIAEEEERIARARGNHLEADRIADTVARFGGGDWLVACDNGGTVRAKAVSYTHLRAHETPEHLVCRLLLEKKKKKNEVNTEKI